ncbi:MAG: hypothetical protein C4527_17490 [Candidatus Omnitrophota bacterium]|jgi:hypothetical protein|nr:MAG: hypothetical protein C4527_17490 [Candidatus Omnitrophota bacterium]
MNKKLVSLNRRDFVRTNALSGMALFAVSPFTGAEELAKLIPNQLIKGLKQETDKSPIDEAVWYAANAVGDGLLYRFPKGLLAGAKYLSADIVVDGVHLVVFSMQLQEGENGPAFRMGYKGLNQASARIRLPMEFTNLNRWRLEREGAWLKPSCGGDRIDLNEVDRIRLIVGNKSDQPARWCQTPLYLWKEEAPRMKAPLLPKGKLLDEMGQSTIHDWPAKTRSVEQLTKRLQDQLATAATQNWPDHFTRWGGWKERKIDGNGFFAVHNDGKRWWLVDPDGHFFWSTGQDCVRAGIDSFCEGLESALTFQPDRTGDFKAIYGRQSIDYLRANLIRTFGPEAWHEKWAQIALSQLRAFGFNTVANWSEWQIAREAKFPYVRPLSTHFSRSQNIYRDFPDVYHPDFQKDAESFAQQLRETLDDAAMIGYFLMNEPTWGFSSESPAAGMLFTTPSCETRNVLSAFLQQRYETNDKLSQSWGIPATFAAIGEGEWKIRLTENAKKDLFDFSELMVEKFFKTLSECCKKVDPHHLNLGIRYQGVPPQWTVKGMQSFDVFSMNCYRSNVPLDTCKEIVNRLHMPVMIGEFHFGALDVGLPSPGLVHVRTQEDRGKAYRYYVEDAAANPYCVGVHYFTLYDQSAMGRFDGENYNIGFLDVCNSPYEPMTNAARETHERIYQVANGEVPPFADKPEYLPRLF